MQKSVILLILFIFTVFTFFKVSHAADICTSESNCPPNDADCALTCGGSISNEAATIQDYYNVSVSQQQRITITMTPGALTNYNLYTLWLNNTCPTTSYYNCSPQLAGAETCSEDLLPGIYQVMVRKVSGNNNYSLSVSCGSLQCNSCGLNSPTNGCSLRCGQNLTNLDTSNYQYFKFNLNKPTHVYVNLDYSGLVNYNLSLNYTPQNCPLASCSDSSRCCAPGNSGPENCDKELVPGTYYIRVDKVSGTGAYNLSLSCTDVKIDKPTVISPQNKTYIDYSIGLTTKCIGSFLNYYINYSLDNGQNITFSGSPISNNTDATEIIYPSYSSHNVYFTCYNGLITSSSDKIYFTLTEPVYNFNAWAEGPGLYTIGKTEYAGVYVRNTGNIVDSYNITNVIKTAKKGFDSVPQLIEIAMPSNFMSSINNGSVGNTFVRITVKGQIDQGNVTFIINSSKTGVFSRATISVVSGSPIALPEFELIGVIQIIIIASIIFALFHFKRVRFHGKKK